MVTRDVTVGVFRRGVTTESRRNCCKDAKFCLSSALGNHGHVSDRESATTHNALKPLEFRASPAYRRPGEFKGGTIGGDAVTVEKAQRVQSSSGFPGLVRQRRSIL